MKKKIYDYISMNMFKMHSIFLINLEKVKNKKDEILKKNYNNIILKKELLHKYHLKIILL